MGKFMKAKISKQPNERQKKTLANLLANGGKSMKQAMIKAGYSEAYSKNSGKLTNSQTWQDLTAEVLSDSELIKVHKELLSNKDWRARDAGLEKAYKIRGKYAPEQMEITKREYQDLSNAELVALKKKLTDFLLKK
jgi:hypothetical protein